MQHNSWQPKTSPPKPSSSSGINAKPMPSNPQEPSKKVHRACDCCHARKIRCDGNSACANCQMAKLPCTYRERCKPGPRPRLKNKDAAGAARTSIYQPYPVPILDQHGLHITQSPSDPGNGPPGTFKSSPLVSEEFIRCCLDAFFAHKYPIMPILDEDYIYSIITQLHSLPEQYGLITALCAVIVLQPEILGSSHDALKLDSRPSADFLVGETNRARNFCNQIENPSLASVQTSFFLFAVFFSLGKDNYAWFHIRESITILQLQRLHEEATYTTMADPQHATFCRRTFWLLFITERAYAIQRHRPITLTHTICLPAIERGPKAGILFGFLDLVFLFYNFDDTFLSLWNLSPTSSPGSPRSLIKLQDVLNRSIPNMSERTEIQQADLLVSRQWLKTMVWQLCLSKGLLFSSPSTDDSMSFHYPVNIARDVVLMFQVLPQEAFEANGVGILEKVFDIGCSLADVLILNPKFVRGPVVGPMDYLMGLLRILRNVSGGSSRYLELLSTKADECWGTRIRGSLSSSESSYSGGERDEDRVVDEEQGPAHMSEYSP